MIQPSPQLTIPQSDELPTETLPKLAAGSAAEWFKRKRIEHASRQEIPQRYQTG
jgi:hypothetical protein